VLLIDRTTMCGIAWRLASIVAFASLTACTTVTVESYNVAKNPNVEAAYIATDADFSQYSRLYAEDMGIFFPAGAPLLREDQLRLRQIFREAFLSRLGAYEIVEQPGPGVMAVQASLIDLRESTGAEVMDIRRSLRDAAKPGSLVFIMELRDSETSKTLARAADSAAAPRFGAAGAKTDWDGVETAVSRWAELFVNFLDQNLGR